MRQLHNCCLECGIEKWQATRKVAWLKQKLTNRFAFERIIMVGLGALCCLGVSLLIALLNRQHTPIDCWNHFESHYHRPRPSSWQMVAKWPKPNRNTSFAVKMPRIEQKIPQNAIKWKHVNYSIETIGHNEIIDCAASFAVIRAFNRQMGERVGRTFFREKTICILNEWNSKSSGMRPVVELEKTHLFFHFFLFVWKSDASQMVSTAQRNDCRKNRNVTLNRAKRSGNAFGKHEICASLYVVREASLRWYWFRAHETFCATSNGQCGLRVCASLSLSFWVWLLHSQSAVFL